MERCLEFKREAKRARTNPSVLKDTPLPIGIPAVFIDNAHANTSASDDEVEHYRSSLLHQYRNACGYQYTWGHVIEDAPLSSRQRLVTSWRIVPVAIYESGPFASVSNMYAIPLLLREFRRSLDPAWARDVPVRFRVTGCGDHAHFNSHALFSLTAIDPRFDVELRNWIDATFLPSCMPILIDIMQTFILTTHFANERELPETIVSVR